MRPLEASLLCLVLATGTVAGNAAIEELREDVRRAERETVDLTTQNRALAERLTALEELDVLRARLAEMEALVAERDPQLDGRIDLAEAGVAELRDELLAREAQLEEAFEAQEAAVEALVTVREDLIGRVLTERLTAELASLEGAVDARLGALSTHVSDALVAAEAGRVALDELRGSLPAPADVEDLWRDLVAPVVQIHGPFSVGSGVLLESRETVDGAETHLLTAWHVVRDVQVDPEDPVTPVPVRIYLEGGGERNETATVLARDAVRDVCLLRLDSTRPVPHGARLASRERVERLATFEPVVAVGCPLGTDPLPTAGAVATPSHLVDGVRYMMINAPTYIGNSGGGIFDGNSHELVGVFAKIYNHGTLRPTIVPHMGLVVPLDEIYAWLDGEGFAVLEEEGRRHLARRDAPTGADAVTAPRVAGDTRGGAVAAAAAH